MHLQSQTKILTLFLKQQLLKPTNDHVVTAKETATTAIQRLSSNVQKTELKALLCIG